MGGYNPFKPEDDALSRKLYIFINEEKVKATIKRCKSDPNLRSYYVRSGKIKLWEPITSKRPKLVIEELWCEVT